MQVSRNSVVSNNLSRIAVNIGDVGILPNSREITGRNPERDDDILGPSKAAHFAGFFVARFSEPFASWGTATNDTLHENETSRTDQQVMGYVRFADNVKQVDIRVGVSFISVDQARANLDAEIPDGTPLEVTAFNTRQAWAEKLDRIQIEGATTDQQTVFYTGFFHALQYPYEVDEGGRYYSGYDDQVPVHSIETWFAWLTLDRCTRGPAIQDIPFGTPTGQRCDIFLNRAANLATALK